MLSHAASCEQYLYFGFPMLPSSTVAQIFTTILKQRGTSSPVEEKNGGRRVRAGWTYLRRVIKRFFCLGFRITGGGWSGSKTWLRLRLAMWLASESLHLAQRTKQLWSDFEVKSTVYKQRQSQSVQEGWQFFFFPLVLFIILLFLILCMSEVKSTVWLPRQSFV